MNGDGQFHVHVDNIAELLGTVKTETVEATHYATATFLLPATGANSGPPVNILQLDPLRKRAVVSLNGTGQVIICHSQQQAQSAQQAVQPGADTGSTITAPATFTAEGTAPLWAVGVPTSGSMAVGVVAERRDS